MAKKTNSNGVYTKEQQINDLLSQTQESPLRKRKIGTLGINTNPEPVSNDIDTNASINPDTTDAVDNTVEEQTTDTSATSINDAQTEEQPKPRRRKIYTLAGYVKRNTSSNVAANSSIMPDDTDDSDTSQSSPKISIGDLIDQNKITQFNSGIIDKDNTKHLVISELTNIAPNYVSSVSRMSKFNNFIYEFRQSDAENDFTCETINESDARMVAKSIWKTIDRMSTDNRNINKSNVKSIIHSIATDCNLTDDKVMKVLSVISYEDVGLISCKTKPQYSVSGYSGSPSSISSSSISACTSISASSNKTSNDTRTTTSSTGANINISYGDIQVTVSSPVATTNTGTVSTPEPSSAKESKPTYDSSMVHAYNNMSSSDRQVFAKLYDEIDRLTNKR